MSRFLQFTSRGRPVLVDVAAIATASPARDKNHWFLNLYGGRWEIVGPYTLAQLQRKLNRKDHQCPTVT